MTTLKFKCELLSDVILNQKAASESQNQTLDFIPGSCFLGISADTLYKTKDYDFCREVFHSTKVKFGDAHPVAENAVKRSLKIPACYQYPKGKKLTDGCYISFIVNHDDPDKQKLQLKQAREGFFDIDGDSKEPILTKVTVDTDIAIKSAYDREKRRSADEQMYCYESLAKGLTLYFEVVVDGDFADDIRKSLVGKKRIGRSRTAQYGLVQISECKFDDVASRPTKNDYSVVYADSRLVFLDEYGYPTFQPTAKQLGFDEKDVIDWGKSQIRTFQYAPWNYQRQCFDADRCGIEKGSVFVVKTANSPTESQYVGNYQNEGFGKVIYNPDFVMNFNDEGLSNYDIDLNIPEKKKAESKETRRKRQRLEIEQLQKDSDGLLLYLATQKQAELDEEIIYETVNQFVKDYKNDFVQDSFASQWGSIRAIAMRYSTYAELKEELFDKKITKNGKPEPYAYLTHGVALNKWKKRGRFDKFRDFFNSLSQEGNFAQKVLINLAAQMAKIKNLTNMESIYTHRFLARMIIEAKTPLAVGSGDKDITTDALVATDVNGLPYIPGTTIAGVIRHFIGDEKAKRFFGFQNKAKQTESRGSEIIFSNAKILNSESEVVEGLQPNAFDDPLLKNYKSLPIRQHVKINTKGTAKDKGQIRQSSLFCWYTFLF